MYLRDRIQLSKWPKTPLKKFNKNRIKNTFIMMVKVDPLANSSRLNNIIV